jgi:hypothetical protein
MSESPQAQPREPQAQESEADSRPAELPRFVSVPGAPSASVLPEPSDESPTIISRLLPRPVRPDALFGVALRGRRLAHFELLEPIGIGGMATVIRARDTQLDRVVALKILPPETAGDPETVRRFQQEARAAARLDHENIARVFFCGEDQGLHFIAFEFVEGENLRTALERRGPLPVAEAVNCLLQIAGGLAHAASRGVVHRDIKPSNIIIASDGRAKLVDMGLARSLERQADLELTASGVTLGTVDYIAPEQALEPRDADVRSDIYALGCTFYHMLTGRPPVPDGTVAKKLHHHQQVPPTDPRRFNPDVPADVAEALARMMAKDPADRYQRPEHLVQHLAQIAHGLGALRGVPEGVRFADPPLPWRRRRRRAAMATAMVVVLSVGLAWWLVGRDTPNRSDARAPASGVTPVDRAVATRPAPIPPSAALTENGPFAPTPRLDAREVATAAQLADFLADFAQQKRGVAQVALTRDLDLTHEERSGRQARPEQGSASLVPGLVVQSDGGELVIGPGPEFGDRLATVRLTYDPALAQDTFEGSPIWSAFTVRGGTVKLRRLRFVLDAAQAAQISMTAVRLQEKGRLILEECEFIQVGPVDPSQVQLCSVFLQNAPGAPVKPTDVNSCYFGSEDSGWPSGAVPFGGQTVLAVDGPADIRLKNCAFGPHARLCAVRGGSPPDAINVRLQNCSAFVVDGSAFDVRVNDGVTCQFIVRESVFSRPSSVFAGGNAALIQQAGDTGEIRYDGYDNRYHNLSAFWVRSATAMQPAQVLAGGWDSFQQGMRPDGVKEANSRVLTLGIWADKKDPLHWLRKQPPEPRRAFAVDVRSPDARQTDEPTKRLVGVEYCTWGLTYENELPGLDDQRSASAGAVKVVDPATDGKIEGVYASLRMALDDESRPGDVIVIKHDGLLRVDPVRLEKATMALTIKPTPGMHPVLTLAENSDKDTALFRVHDGSLRLEGLEFYLHPGQDEVHSQTVADVVGDGQCVFSNCVATLSDPHGTRLSVAALSDPTGAIKTDAQPIHKQVPRVQFKRCFIRGDGELVAVRASRPSRLQVENSLVALAGSLLDVEGAARESSAPLPIQMSLRRVTTYLSDHLVRLAGRDFQDVVPVAVDSAEECLFATSTGRSLMRLDGPRTTDFEMRYLFSWKGRQNAYSSGMPILDQKPRGEETPLNAYGLDRWKSFADEQGELSIPVTFVDAPAQEALARTTPSRFRLKSDGERLPCGAHLDDLPGPREAAPGAMLAPLP